MASMTTEEMKERQGKLQARMQELATLAQRASQTINQANAEQNQIAGQLALLEELLAPEKANG